MNMKITIEHFDEKYVIEKELGDIDDAHETWEKILLLIGFTNKTIREKYDEQM